MSLQIWLPFVDGTLKQQGLNNVVATANGAVTLTDTGKLGKCATFGTATGRVTVPASAMTSFTECSVAFWVNILAWQTNWDTFFQAGLGKSPWSNYTFGVLRNSGNHLVFCISDNTSDSASTQGNCKTSDLNLNTWYHVAFTYKAGHMCTYVNGNLIQDYTTSIIPKFSGITYISIGQLGNATSYQTSCKMNDFRIYDHCLSPMEVKELAKGLVLHYSLNRQGWGQDNILLNTGFQARYTQSTGWNTTKNGTQLANSWGGYNSGVGNQATVYHAHLKEFNGEWVYEYIKTADESWLGISQGGLQSRLTAGKKYTFSWEQYSVSGSNYNHGGLYYFKTGASSASFHLGSFSGTGGITGQWKKFSYTFTAPSDADYSKNMSWYIYGMNGGNGTLYMRHPKLEEGSIATPWCPNSSDALATTMGLNSTTEYDCSGFCNNGTRTGTFTWTSDAPKYAVSQVFNGIDNAIQTPNLTTMVTDKNYTIACWTYKTVIGTKNYQTIYGGPSGFELEARSSSSTSPLYRIHNWGGGTTAYNFGEWTHFCFVHTDSDSKLYVNGELKITGTSVNVPSGNYFVGAWNTSTSQNYEGNMSDFRIYATALSADDVKSLYQNSAYIDSSGNVYGTIHEV